MLKWKGTSPEVQWFILLFSMQEAQVWICAGDLRFHTPHGVAKKFKKERKKENEKTTHNMGENICVSYLMRDLYLNTLRILIIQ